MGILEVTNPPWKLKPRFAGVLPATSAAFTIRLFWLGVGVAQPIWFGEGEIGRQGRGPLPSLNACSRELTKARVAEKKPPDRGAISRFEAALRATGMFTALRSLLLVLGGGIGLRKVTGKGSSRCGLPQIPLEQWSNACRPSVRSAQRRESAYVRWRRGPRLVPSEAKLSDNPPWSFASPCKGGRSGVPEVAGREYRLSGSLRFLLGFASLKGAVRSALRSGVWADPGQSGRRGGRPDRNAVGPWANQSKVDEGVV
jgi:hypothetical protein